MVTAHWLATDSMLIGGDDAIRERILPGAAAGSALGAFALTEPGAGSNPADMTTFAAREGDGYRLQRHQALHLERRRGRLPRGLRQDGQGGRRPRHLGVRRGARARGVRVAAPEQTMGLRGGHVFEIALDCVVPVSRSTGSRRLGFRTALKVLDAGRIEIAACAVGVAEAALAAAVAWAQGAARRRRADRAIPGLALDAGRHGHGHRGGARARDSPRRASGKARTLFARGSMAKLFASEMVARVTDHALQIHGGYGYTTGLPLERYVAMPHLPDLRRLVRNPAQHHRALRAGRMTTTARRAWPLRPFSACWKVCERARFNRRKQCSGMKPIFPASGW